MVEGKEDNQGLILILELVIIRNCHLVTERIQKQVLFCLQAHAQLRKNVKIHQLESFLCHFQI